jgi:hypothetical protein
VTAPREGKEAAERPESERVPLSTRGAAFLAAGLLRTLRATLRLRSNADGEVRAWERADRRFILAFWHRHLLFMPR